MQVSVESPSKIQRRVTIVVPVEQMDQAYDQRIIKLSKTIKINGFRPGKVPVDVVKKRYGDTARQEALSEVIQSSLYTAMENEKLNPVGVPLVEPKTVFPGQPLEFVATFDVLPVIDQVNFDVTNLEKEVATIQEDDITKVIEHLRTQNNKWQIVSRAAEKGDQVVINFNGKIEGVEFPGAQAKGYPIVLGSQTMIPGFEEGLVGCVADEDKIIPVTFPENYFAKEIAGKKAEFIIKVLRVMEANLPTVDEKFIKGLGVESGQIEDLRNEIRKNLERELDRLIRTKLKAKTFDKLLDQNEIEIPKALVEQEAKRLHDQLHPNHDKGEHHHTEEDDKMFNDMARKNVALGLLVGQLVKLHKITPDQARIDSHIRSMSGAYEDPEEVSQWYAKNKRALAEVQMQVLEDQVVEKLLETVQITEKVLTYSEIVKNQQVVA